MIRRLIHCCGLTMLIGILLPKLATQLTVSEENCEICKFNKEIDELKYMLSTCQEELQECNEKKLAHEEVQSSSALSYLGSIFSGITSSSKRSSPLHNTVNTFLQNLDIGEKRNLNEIEDTHEVDVR